MNTLPLYSEQRVLTETREATRAARTRSQRQIKSLVALILVNYLIAEIYCKKDTPDSLLLSEFLFQVLSILVVTTATLCCVGYCSYRFANAITGMDGPYDDNPHSDSESSIFQDIRTGALYVRIR